MGLSFLLSVERIKSVEGARVWEDHQKLNILKKIYQVYESFRMCESFILELLH